MAPNVESKTTHHKHTEHWQPTLNIEVNFVDVNEASKVLTSKNRFFIEK
jgi:hypothetical protein